MGLDGVGLLDLQHNVSNAIQLVAFPSKSANNNSGAIGREFESLRARHKSQRFAPVPRALKFSGSGYGNGLLLIQAIFEFAPRFGTVAPTLVCIARSELYSRAITLLPGGTERARIWAVE